VVRAGGALRPFIGAKGASGHGEGGGALRRRNQGGLLRLQFGIFKMRSSVAG
jgi:hypothetical protein